MHLYRNIMFAIPAVATAALVWTAWPLRWWDAPWAILNLLLLNFLEYTLHRWPMHRPGTLLYEHVTIHHKAVHARWNHIEDRNVILPPYVMATVAGIIGTVSGLLWLWSPRAALLFAVCGTFYYLIYELLHYAFHRGSLLLLAHHHLIHHRHSVRNFNIFLPIFDTIFGTRL